VLIIKVEYLTDVCMATRHNDPSRSTAEWPPHPDRLYSALVAAANPTDADDESAVALRWLAKQGAPQLAVSEARRRSAPDVHVPTNPHEEEVWQKHKKGKPRTPQKSFDLKTLLPIHRKKAGLPIPAVIPDDASVYFIWFEAQPDETATCILKTICEQVAYLGRSRSLVRVSVADCAPPATYVPDPLGQVQLRVPGANRLGYLIEKYGRDGGKPEPSPPRRYRSVKEKEQHKHLRPTFDRMFIFRPQPGCQALPAEATLNVTKALRQALLKRVHDAVCDCGGWSHGVLSVSEALDCYRKIPPLISGYDCDENGCTPTKVPHLAFAALPFVDPDVRHADGSIKGLAVLVPNDPDQGALELIATGLTGLLEAAGIRIPGVGTWRLDEVTADSSPIQTLNVRSWTASSRVWSTVTPMMFGRVPKDKQGGEPAVILASLGMIGVDPDSVLEIAVGRHSPLNGVPPSWEFNPRLQGAFGQSQPWMLRHVTVRFNQQVYGPLILGRMRYFGLGLMRPWEEPA